MATPAKRLATYQDLLALPDNVVGELIHGELLASPRPGGRHAKVASVLGSDIGSPFGRGRGGPGGWQILFESELHLGEDVLVPDLAGWRLARMPTVPDEPFFRLPPDWICEVLSPGTGRRDRQDKLPIYAQAEVSHALLINPGERTLEVFKLAGGKWLLLGTHGGDDVVRAEPFDAVALELRALWE